MVPVRTPKLSSRRQSSRIIRLRALFALTTKRSKYLTRRGESAARQARSRARDPSFRAMQEA
jgi:hypothetical protein